MITVDGARYILGLLCNLTAPYPTLWIALSAEELGPTATGFDVVEYSRIPIDNLASNWELTGTTLTLSIPIVFEESQSPWGTIRGMAVCTEETGGLVLMEDELPSPIHVDEGVQVTIEPGGISFDIDVDRWSM